MGPMTILVTGAGGYLGQATVRAALARGHRVRALVRRAVDLPGAVPANMPATMPPAMPAAMPPGVEVFSADLAQGGPIPGRAALDVGAVIHCAARLSGPEAAIIRDTVTATEGLFHAILTTGQQPRMVLVSSLSVYGAGGLPPGALLDETCPLETRGHLRDAYTRAKMAQEGAALRLAAAGRLPLWLIRPGIIWGPGHLANPHLGIGLGPLLLRAGAGQLPIAHVDHVAAALVAAAETRPDGAEALNILDDDLPTRARWLAAAGGAGIVIPLHWRVPDALAGLLAPLAPRLPGLLRRPTLRARLMPLTYTNGRARARLDWQPGTPFADAMRAAHP